MPEIRTLLPVDRRSNPLPLIESKDANLVAKTGSLCFYRKLEQATDPVSKTISGGAERGFAKSQPPHLVLYLVIGKAMVVLPVLFFAHFGNEGLARGLST